MNRTLLLVVLAAVGAAVSTGASAGDQRPSRPPIGNVLPKQFGFGISCFSAAGDWPERMVKERGVRWDYLYIYVAPDWNGKGGTHWDYLSKHFERCQRLSAIPILSYYGMLKLADLSGHTGSEIERVNAVIRDRAVMKVYFEEVARVMKMCARHQGYVIFHSEPDSWAFMQWHGSNDTHDATQVPAAVGSCGMPDVAEFPDNAGGLAKALVHLRDLYAPQNTYMGFHAKDCRVGMWPERTVKFIKGCGTWDILLGDGIGHVLKTRGEGWWDSWDESLHRRYMDWFGTITRETGLKYIHWQSIIGKADYTLLPDYPATQRVSDYIKAGSVGVTFDLRVKPGADPGSTGGSDPNHGYSLSPPPGHPAQKTPNDLIERLARYYRNPIPLDQSVVRVSKPESAPATQPVPIVKAPVVSSEALDEWQARLVKKIDSLGKSGSMVTLFMREEGRYSVRGADATSLIVEVQGNRLPMPWKQLSADDRAALAKEAARDGDTESLLIAAVLHLACGKGEQAEEYFAKAALKDADATKAARAALLAEP